MTETQTKTIATYLFDNQRDRKSAIDFSTKHKPQKGENYGHSDIKTDEKTTSSDTFLPIWQINQLCNNPVSSHIWKGDWDETASLTTESKSECSICKPYWDFFTAISASNSES